MRVKYKEISEAWRTLDKLIDQQLPAAFGLKFARIHKALKPYYDLANETVKATVHPLLVMAGENPMRDEKGAFVFRDGVTVEEFQAALLELDTLEVDVDIEPLETRPVPGLKITPRQIEELDPFIIFV